MKDDPPPRRRRNSSSTKAAGDAPANSPLQMAAAGANRPAHRRRPILVAVCLAVAVLGVYWQVRGFDFVELDDAVYVSANLHVQGGLTPGNIAWSLDAFHDSNWIPLTWLSLMLDTTIFGFHAGAYHFTNVLLHAANAILLFAFLARATGNQLRSACVAALFALHPLHVESVAWITERKDVLSALFGLISLWTYVDWVKSGRRWSLAACYSCFVLSLLAKQTLVTLPFVFLLLDYWPLGRLRERVGRARVVLEKLPLLAISAAFSAITLLAQSSGRAVTPLESLPLWARSLNALVVYAVYLRQAFWPVGLAVYYPHPGSKIAWGAIALSATLLLAISVTAVVRVRRDPWLFVGWAWFLGTLVPMIGIVQVGGQERADRYTYFPLIGLCLAVVWLVSELVPMAGRRVVLPAVSFAAFVALGAPAFFQIGYWRDSVTLFRHAVACTPDNPLATSALGYALLVRGHGAEGLTLLEAAARMGPDDAQAQYNVAVGLQSAGRGAEAADHYRRAIALNDQDADAYTNLGVLLCQEQKYAAAKKLFLRAIAINPEHVNAYVNLGTLCLDLGDYAGTIDYSQRALALDPHLERCQMNIDAARRALATKGGS